MAQAVTLRDMPSSDGDIPPMYLYDDKWLDICINYLEKAHPWMDRVRVSPFYDEEIPSKFQNFLSQKPYSGGQEKVDEVNTSVRPEFKKELTKTQQGIFKDIEDKYGAGPAAETWTVKRVVELTNATDSKNTVRSAVNKFEKLGWATQSGEATSKGDKKRRLTDSRYSNPDAMTDGGGYEWIYDWDTAIGELEDRQLWDAVTHNPTKFDPKDWFASKNEKDIIGIFRDMQRANDYLLQIYETRYDYETEIKDYGLDSNLLDKEERVGYIEHIREQLESLQNALNDIFVKLSNLASKAFRSCSNWWMSGGPESSSRIATEYLPTEKSKTIEKRVNAKRWGLNETHIDPIVDGNPKTQADDQNYTERVYELERSVRALLRVGWYMKNDLLEGTEPVEESNESEEDAVVSYQEEPRELTRQEECVELTLKDITKGGPMAFKERNSTTWDEFVKEYREWTRTDMDESVIATKLKSYHNWCQETDHDYGGVHVWDMNDGDPSKEQELRLILADAEFFADAPHHAKWPDNPELEIPPF